MSSFPQRGKARMRAIVPSPKGMEKEEGKICGLSM